MTITALPTPPSRNDPANFATRADAILGALPTFVTEANALQTDVNAKQATASTAASTATTQAAAAAASAALANATAWVSGTTYAIGDARYSLINFQTYRRITSGGGATDPSLDATNWSFQASVLVETVYALTGTTPELYVANGTIQTWTLTGNSTPTSNLISGQSLTLMINDGSAYAITWPSVVWSGGVAPALAASGYTLITLWKVGATLYGVRAGSVA